MLAATLTAILTPPKPNLLQLTVRRIEAFKAALVSNKIVDKTIVYSAQSEHIWETVEKHLAAPTKDFRGYDVAAKKIKTAFGEKTFEWVLMYTRYMEQTYYLLKKERTDEIVDSPAKLV